MKNTKINLCATCTKEIPECNSVKIEFGDGVGNDNVIECDTYEQKQEPEQQIMT